MNEQLSAFLDGEATRDEVDSVVSALLRDEKQRESWSRQHWIRTTLRAHSSEVAVAPDLDFSRRVMSVIAADDHQETVSSISDSIVRSPRVRPRRWRGFAGFGVAAAVASVVFMSGNPFLRSSDTGEARFASATSGTSTARSRDAGDTNNESDAIARWNDRLADFSTIGGQAHDGGARSTVASAGASSAFAGARARSVAATSGADRWSVSDPAVRDELNGYLADHSGMARGYGMSSTTPAYVRVAAYGQGAGQ